MKKNIAVFFCLLLTLCLLLSACVSKEPFELYMRPLENHRAKDLQAMYDAASFIVVGTFGDYELNGNMNEELDEPYTNYFQPRGESRIYEFHVEEIWKNNVDDLRETIKVAVPYRQLKEGILLPEVTGDRKEDSYSIPFTHAYFIEPKEDARYLLFLCSIRSGRYRAATEPYRIRIDEGDILALESNLTLSEEEKEIHTLQTGVSTNGRELFFHSQGLDSSFDDQISGLTLQEAQEQLGVKNVFTFPYQH